MQKFIAEPSFWELLPDTRIGIIVVRGMVPASEIPAADCAEIARILDRANDRADRWLTSDVISENEVVRVWRDAYRTFKSKGGARCAVENLLKRVLKGKPVGSITPSVDIYNAISLTYALPVGGENIDTVVGDFRLGVDAEGGKDFLPIGEDEPAPTLPGELCYYDDAGAICRCWNWRDGQRTELTDDSENAILVMECVDPAREADLRTALDEFASLMERYLHAEVTVKDVVTRDNPELVIVP